HLHLLAPPVAGFDVPATGGASRCRWRSTTAPPTQTTTGSGPAAPGSVTPGSPRSRLDDEREDHRAAPVALVDPAAHDPAHDLLQLVGVGDALGGRRGERVGDA